MIRVVEHLEYGFLDDLSTYLSSVPNLSSVGYEHDPRWMQVLRDELGHRPVPLVGQSTNGRICAYLPLVLVSGPLFGRFLVSLPYVNRAGVLAQDPDVAAALIERAVKLAYELDVKYVKLRHCQPIGHADLPHARDDKSLMMLELAPDAETLWKSFNSKVRNQIRKGQKHNLVIRWSQRLDESTDQREDLSADLSHTVTMVNQFYEIFSINMRDLGTPVYPQTLFEQILARFSREAEFAIVDCEGHPIAAALLIHDRGRTQVSSASCLRHYNSTNTNMWMYHQLLLRAIARGSRKFDFGRSSEDSGTYRFKKQWGAMPIPRCSNTIFVVATSMRCVLIVPAIEVASPRGRSYLFG